MLNDEALLAAPEQRGFRGPQQAPELAIQVQRQSQTFSQGGQGRFANFGRHRSPKLDTVLP